MNVVWILFNSLLNDILLRVNSKTVFPSLVVNCVEFELSFPEVYGNGVLSHGFRLTLISTSSDMMDHNFLQSWGLATPSVEMAECRCV